MHKKLSWEWLFWLALLGLTLVSRFWDLGKMAMHHDESLHATYSYYFSEGMGFVHNPMLHGSFQFHLWAVSQWIFGSSETSVRAVGASLNVAVVLSPYLLRPYVGKLIAALAALLLLCSPTILYYGRFAREDAFLMFAEAGLIVGLAGYLYSKKLGYFYLITVAVALLFTIKSTAYITSLLVGLPLLILFLWQLSKRLFFVSLAWLLTTAGLLGLLLHFSPLPPLPPGNAPSLNVITAYFSALLQSTAFYFCLLALTTYLMLAVTLLYHERSLSLPDPQKILAKKLLQNGFLLIVPSALVLLIGSRQQQELALTFSLLILTFGLSILASHLNSTRLGSLGASWVATKTGLLVQLSWQLISDLRRLYLAVGLFGLIWSFFYTSMYQNMQGLMSGSVGMLGYWLAQQDVRRGDQPWFYYLLLLGSYEFLLLGGVVLGLLWLSYRYLQPKVKQQQFIFLSLAVFMLLLSTRLLNLSLYGILFVLTVGLVISLIAYTAWWRNQPEAQRIFYLVLTFWSVGAVLIYSWAGEKMPWLVVHIVQPAIIPAAAILAMLLTKLWQFRQLPANSKLLTGSLSLLLLCCLLFTGFTAYRFNRDSDITPQEIGSYVQTSPAFRQVMLNIQAFSQNYYGKFSSSIRYSSAVSWPLVWYMRKASNLRPLTGIESSNPDFILVGSGETIPFASLDYIKTTLPLRWWFDEDSYRSLIPAVTLPPDKDHDSPWVLNVATKGTINQNLTLLNKTLNTLSWQQLASWLNYELTRDPPSTGAHNSTDFDLYVRQDLYPLYQEQKNAK